MAVFRHLVQWMLPIPTGPRAGPYPCCTVRTSSLEQSRVVNQTEYWLKYWYNDTSDGEEDDQEMLAGLWKPPELEDDEDIDIIVTPGTVSAVNAARSNSMSKSLSVPQFEKKNSADSNGVSGESSLGVPGGGNFGLARAMRLSIAPLVTPTISEQIPVAEPEPEPEPEPELSYFDKINNMIRSQLETSYGHPPLNRENSEDADVEDNSVEERNFFKAGVKSLLLLETSVKSLPFNLPFSSHTSYFEPYFPSWLS